MIKLKFPTNPINALEASTLGWYVEPVYGQFPTNPINALEARHFYVCCLGASLNFEFPTNPINALEARCLQKPEKVLHSVQFPTNPINALEARAA